MVWNKLKLRIRNRRHQRIEILTQMKEMPCMESKACPKCNSRDSVCCYDEFKENKRIYDFICSECYTYYQIEIPEPIN